MDIIQHIIEEMVADYSAVEKKFGKDYDLTELLLKTKQIGMTAVRKMVAASLENLDETIRQSAERKENWHALRKEEKTLGTSLGEVKFRRTLYRSKGEEKEHSYLLDEIIGLESHQRFTEDAVASMLEEAAATSYEKSGNDSCMDIKISRETVKEYVHSLRFPKDNYTGPKKKVDYLYIDADEDHVSLQFRDHKGDLTHTNGFKNNTSIQKIVYVYEGKKEVGSKHSPRRELINVHYFCGAYTGTQNDSLWKEVYEYIDRHYEISSLKALYLNADGGSWISGGAKCLGNYVTVLDQFHLEKYLTRLTSGLGEKMQTIKDGLRTFLREGDCEQFQALVKGIREETPKNSVARIDEAEKYLLNNWEAARIRLEKNAYVLGCSAEGHVSHTLSSRMSSRPMGWSIVGADKMAHLRAYVFNREDVLQLVRMQGTLAMQCAPEEPEAEKAPLSASQILASEHTRKQDKYFDTWYRNVGDAFRQNRAFKGICGNYSM